MSDTAHTVPGQTILERLYARGAVRPQIGPKATFYERFGLSDPWTDVGTGNASDSDSESMFFFLSAAPYYARLRAQRQREWRARRRLMMRLSEPVGNVSDRAFSRLAGVGGVAGAWLEPTPRVSHMAWSGESAMVALETPGTAETEGEPRVETARDRRERSERRSRPERFLRSERAQRDVASLLTQTSSATRARAVSRHAAPSMVPAALTEILRVASGPARRVLVRVIEEISALPVQQQIVVAQRVTRQLRGPAARLARLTLSDAQVDSSERHVEVAASRAEPIARRSRGLRPVLASSPAMQALTFESPEVDLASAPPTRRVAEVAPRRIKKPIVRVDVPEARVAREVRTQQVTGRAGPVVEAAAIAAEPAPRRSRPTERVASIARETARTAPSDTRYGLATTRADAPRGARRVSERAEVAHAVGSRGERLLSPSPTAHVRAERRERAGYFSAPVASFVELTTEGIIAEGTAPRAARQRVEQEPTAPTRRAADRLAPVADDVTPARETPRGVASSRRPSGSTFEPVDVEPVHGAPRAARRASSAGVLGAAPRRVAVPFTPVVEETGASARAAARLTAGTPDGARRRVSIASRPTSYLDAVVQPVVEEAPFEDAAPSRRFGRPTVRAASRADRPARTDTRGVAVLASAPTDYLGVADAAEHEGPLTRSPLRARPAERSRDVAPESRSLVGETIGAAPRVRPMRGAAVDTSTTLEFPAVAPDVELEQGTTRAARRPAAPARRVSATGRAAERLEATAAAMPTRRAASRGADTPEVDEAPRASILVRDARGRVRPSRRVATGSAAYASARLLGHVSEEVREDRGTERAQRRAVTPVERAAASSRRVVPRAVPHAAVARDFSWLVPEALPALEAPAQTRARRAAAARADVAPTGRARPVRVTGEARATATGAVPRDQVDAIVARISLAVRAVERSLDPGVVLPAARRTVEGARVVAAEPIRRRLRASASEGVLLRVVVDDDESTPMARAERRGALDRAPGAPGAVASPLRRAVPGVTGTPVRPLDQAALRRDGEVEVGPAGRRRAAARTLRTADGRYAPSATRTLRTADGRYTPASARAPIAASEGTLAFGLGSPALAGQVAGDSVRRRAGARFVAAGPVPDDGTARARPLGRTMDYMQGQTRPLRGGTVDMAPLGPQRAPAGYAGPEVAEDLEGEAPAWAQRAVRGTAARRRRRPVPEAETAAPVRRTGGGSGDLFTALARASRPEDVIQVILERGQRIRSQVQGLPEPAVRLVERIARVQEDGTVLRPGRGASEDDGLAPSHRTRGTAASASVRMSSLPGGGGASPAAIRKVTSLADKLMKLIHLAEVERRQTDAQRQVRMARAAQTHEGSDGEAAPSGGDAPSMKQLESDVLKAVIRDLDLMKNRQPEDFGNVWW